MAGAEVKTAVRLVRFTDLTDPPASEAIDACTSTRFVRTLNWLCVHRYLSPPERLAVETNIDAAIEMTGTAYVVEDTRVCRIPDTAGLDA